MDTVLYYPSCVYTVGQFKRRFAIAVKGDTIVSVAPEKQVETAYPHALRMDWSGYALIPGTVNVHNHSFQSLLRGIAADRPFLEWRDRSLYRYSPRMEPEDIYTGALFAFGEMMRCGVSTVSDFFYLHNFGLESDRAVIQAAKDIGIRLVLARTMYDWTGAPAGYVESIETAVRSTRILAAEYQGNDMVNVLPAPHSLHAASPEMILAGYDLAKELGTAYHIHVAEEPFEVQQTQKAHGGLHTIEYLDTLGVVDASMVIVHGVWLEKSEIELLGERGARLAYCPSSNMFLADGITDIPAMRKAGVRIGLGSDGACGNNRISVFEEMRMASLLQKANTCDAMALGYKAVFDMGTKDGAELLGLKTGEIAPGFKADFAGIDLHDLSMQPISAGGEQILPNIVYAMQPTAIRKMVVNGRQTVEDGHLLTQTEQSISERVRKTMARLESSSNEKGSEQS